MADQFVGEIRIVGFNFPPTGWAYCNGQLMTISQNTALFSLLGTFYGGDGRTTFGLPNFQGNFGMAQGQGAGLSERFIGETGGSANVTLLQTEMPIHNHGAVARLAGTLNDPTSNDWANPGGRPAPNFFASAVGTSQPMSAVALSTAGSSQPHNNMPPYLTLNFIIALQGIFPARA